MPAQNIRTNRLSPRHLISFVDMKLFTYLSSFTSLCKPPVIHSSIFLVSSLRTAAVLFSSSVHLIALLDPVICALARSVYVCMHAFVVHMCSVYVTRRPGLGWSVCIAVHKLDVYVCERVFVSR